MQLVFVFLLRAARQLTRIGKSLFIGRRRMGSSYSWCRREVKMAPGRLASE